MNIFYDCLFRLSKNFKKNVILRQLYSHYSTSKNTSSAEYCLDLVRIGDCTCAHNCFPIDGPSYKLVLQQAFFNSLSQNKTRQLFWTTNWNADVFSPRFWQYDYENFLCTLLLPNQCRVSAFAIRAFNIEIARIQDQVSDPRLGQMRMKFWEETVEKIFANDTPKHPVALELFRASKKHKLSKRYLKRLITARGDQLTTATFPNLEAQEIYAENSVSSIYYLLLEASGVGDIHADHVASHLGKAQGITNLIRSVPHNIQRKVVSFPQDILLQHNVAHEVILRAKVTKELKDVVFDVASRAKTHLDKARSMSKSIPKSASLLFLPAITVDSYLERLRVSDFNVFSASLQRRNSTLPFVLFWNKLTTKY